MNTYFRNMVKYKDLFIELVIKDIKLKYRNSVLGILWSMLNPLLMMVVISIVFMALFRNEIPNFPVYVLIGRILYHFFTEATSFSMESIENNGQLIRKVYVPKYFFPLSRVVSSFIITFISLLPVVLMMVILGIPFKWINLLFLVPLLLLLLISSGIGLLLSSLYVFFKDIKHFYSVLMLMIMYMTPIFYPVTIIPDKYMPIIELNPLYPIVVMFRDVVMYGQLFSLYHFFLSCIYVVFYCLVGLIVFFKTRDRFIYHL